MFIPISIFKVHEAGNKVDEDSSIYVSYDSKEDDIVAYFQKDLLTNKWGEDYQQNLFREEPKFEEKHSVCGCVLQKDSFGNCLRKGGKRNFLSSVL